MIYIFCPSSYQKGPHQIKNLNNLPNTKAIDYSRPDVFLLIYGCNQRQDSRICVVAGYADHDYAQKPLADEVDDVAGGVPENIISQRIVAHRNFIIAHMCAIFFARKSTYWSVH